MTEQARENLLEAINAEDVPLILSALAEYADLVQKVRLQIKARELISSLQQSTPLDRNMLDELRILVRPASTDGSSTPTLFGIAGQANMGKDTIGTLLRTELPVLKRYAFGDAVKQVVCSTFDVDLDFIEKWKRCSERAPGFEMNMRQVLQSVGDGFRVLRPTVWVDVAMRHASVGVYCDVRYLNEAEALRRHGGVVILVGRTSQLSDDSNASEATLRPLIQWFLSNTSELLVRVDKYKTHVSMAGIENFDYFIRNDGSVDELAGVVSSLVASLKL